MKKKTSHPYQGFPKQEASVPVQLWTGKIGPGSNLKKIRAVDMAVCSCVLSYETVTHILGERPRYDDLRQQSLGQKKIWYIRHC
jgi:hypothetical protein